LPKRDFGRYVSEAVDEGLSSLGTSSKQAIYFHLEKEFNIKPQEIPERITDFSDALEEIFGLGANFIEILIMERLREKARSGSVRQKPGNLTLADYVKAVRDESRQKSLAKRAEEGIIQCEETTL
jgi:hypothetical protein